MTVFPQPAMDVVSYRNGEKHFYFQMVFCIFWANPQRTKAIGPLFCKFGGIIKIFEVC